MDPEVDELKKELEELRGDSERLRNDSATFASILANVGNFGRDNLSGFTVAIPPVLSRIDYDNLYCGNGIATKIINIIPDAETQLWAKYSHSEQEPEDIEAFQDVLDSIKGPYNEARKIARLHGGAAIWIGAEDGNDPAQPIDFKTLKSIDFLEVFQCGYQQPEIWPGETAVLNDDPRSPWFRMPKSWFLYPTGIQIDPSRLFFLYGVKPLSKLSFMENRFTGHPILRSCYNPLRNWDVGQNSVSQLMQKFSRLVFKFRNLVEKRDTASSRAMKMQSQAGVLNAYLLDPDIEELNLLEVSFANIAEILDRQKEYLAANIQGIPHTVLFNESPSGVTSGSSEEKDFAKYINAVQESTALPFIKWYLNIYGTALGNGEGGGRGVNILEGYGIEFPPLYQMDETESSKVELTKAQTAQIYISNAVITPEQVTESIARKIEISDAIVSANMDEPPGETEVEEEEGEEELEQ